MKLALPLAVCAWCAVAIAAPPPSFLAPPPKPWTAPGGLFSIAIPQGWTVELNEKDPYTYDFKTLDPNRDASARLSRIVVPGGSNPTHVALTDIDDLRQALPSFKLIKKQRTRLSGYNAAVVTAVYYFQGNAQFPRFVQRAYVVAGEEAFVFHFECYRDAANSFEDALVTFYNGLALRPPGAVGDPFGVPDNPTPTVENLPF